MSVSFQLIKEISISSKGNADALTMAEEIFINSRNKVNQGLFIPIVGDRFDGHDFLHEAIENGAIAALWQEDHPLPLNLAGQFPIFYVNNTLEALQQLAKKYLSVVAPKVIGVTGSNGKTTTKDLIAAVLSTTYNVHKTAGNFNNHIGLPLTILTMPADCQILILEMGMSNFGEIALLSKLAEPEIAVITNIGEAHIEQLGSRQGIAEAKLEITTGLKQQGILLIDGDEPLLKPSGQFRTIKCGFAKRNHYQVTNFFQGAVDGQFAINENEHYFTQLLGKHNLKNCTYAIAIGKYLGLNEHTIQRGLKQCQLSKMRMEKRAGINQSTIINDAYNASPTSMKAAVETVKQLTGFSKRILILGDIYELGEQEQMLHRSVAEVIAAPITHLFTVGENAHWIAEALMEKNTAITVCSFATKEQVSDQVMPLLDRDSIVLVKASRRMMLESIAEKLYC